MKKERKCKSRRYERVKTIQIRMEIKKKKENELILKDSKTKVLRKERESQKS